MSPLHRFLPLHHPGQTLAWRSGRAISAQQFAGDVQALARRLPERGQMLNGCLDRYSFAVGLAAAMLRGHLSVLPHNHVPSTLSLLREEFPDLYCLAETASVASWPGLPEVISADAHAPPDPALETLEFSADQPCACLFTSGSTGRPVAYTRSWGTAIESARAAARSLGIGPANTTHLLATVPVQHSYGFESSLMLALVTGGTFAAERPFYPADVARLLDELPRPRALITTPVHLRAMVEPDLPLPPADLIVSATAMLDVELARRAEAAFDGALIEIYGATESGQTATRRSVLQRHWDPMPALSFTTDDIGASVSGGHVGPPVRLADALKVAPDGSFLLIGRTADIVNVAGKRNSLAHLDSQLLAIPGVVDGAFLVTDPDSDRQRLAAFYVAPDLAREAVLAALRTRIEAAFMPRPLIALAALPRDATGKVPRQRLLEIYASHRARRGDEPS